jgi:DNA-binding SARP family transcriptional activator
MPFRLVTLGELSLRDAETGQKLAIPRKALALMAILGSEGRDGISRERIISLLWPSAESSGRGSLKQTIYELRQKLGNHGGVIGTAELALDITDISSDIIELDAAYRAGEWSLVVGLYRGIFLDQFHVRDSTEFEHWLDGRRRRYGEMFRKAIEKCAVAATQNGDVNAAVDYWRRLAAEDPLDGRIALGLMNALVGAGDSAGAVRHYVVHQRLLSDELGTDPAADVTSLVEQIRAGDLQPSGKREIHSIRTEKPSQSDASGSSDLSAVEGAQRPAYEKEEVRRRPGTVIAIAVILLIAVAAFAFVTPWRGNAGAHVLHSIELPQNASMRLTMDVKLNHLFADGGASFDNALAIVDGVSLHVRTLPHGSGVAVDPLTHWYWSGDYGGRFVIVRNGRTDAEIGRVPVPGCPHHIAVAGKWILVAQQCDDHISVIESRTRSLVRNIPIATLTRAEVGGAKGMGEILVNPNSGVAYFWKDMIPHRIDTRTWEVRETPAFGGVVVGVDSAHNRLFAQIAHGLRVIDGATERVVANIQLPGDPLGQVAIGFGGNRIYVATIKGVSVIDGRTLELVRTISFENGFVPSVLAADDGKGRLYAAGSGSNGTGELKILDMRD